MNAYDYLDVIPLVKKYLQCLYQRALFSRDTASKINREKTTQDKDGKGHGLSVYRGEPRQNMLDLGIT